MPIASLDADALPRTTVFPPSPLTDLRVVVVEEEGLIQLHLRCILERAGACVVGAANSGPAAVEIVRATRPDLVLTEILLPGPYDGLEVALRMHAMGPICVVVLSTRTDCASQRRARAAGVADYLVKPIVARQLIPALERVLGYQNR